MGLRSFRLAPRARLAFGAFECRVCSRYTLPWVEETNEQVVRQFDDEEHCVDEKEGQEPAEVLGNGSSHGGERFLQGTPDMPNKSIKSLVF